MPLDGYAKLIAACHEAGRPVLVDVGGETLRRGLVAGPDIVKVSAAEARAAGFAGSTIAMARAIVAEGAALAVVTDAARGAAAAGPDRSWRVTAPRIRSINSVGSGDAFAAGLSVALTRGAGIEEALAAAAGAANAEALAAGMINRERVEELVTRVQVRAAAGA
jgi:fructose-1-phosphate kinase PfkB-like protein